MLSLLLPARGDDASHQTWPYTTRWHLCVYTSFFEVVSPLERLHAPRVWRNPPALFTVKFVPSEFLYLFQEVRSELPRVSCRTVLIPSSQGVSSEFLVIRIPYYSSASRFNIYPSFYYRRISTRISIILYCFPRKYGTLSWPMISQFSGLKTAFIYSSSGYYGDGVI